MRATRRSRIGTNWCIGTGWNARVPRGWWTGARAKRPTPRFEPCSPIHRRFSTRPWSASRCANSGGTCPASSWHGRPDHVELVIIDEAECLSMTALSTTDSRYRSIGDAAGCGVDPPRDAYQPRTSCCAWWRWRWCVRVCIRRLSSQTAGVSLGKRRLAEPAAPPAIRPVPRRRRSGLVPAGPVRPAMRPTEAWRRRTPHKPGCRRQTGR